MPDEQIVIEFAPRNGSYEALIGSGWNDLGSNYVWMVDRSSELFLTPEALGIVDQIYIDLTPFLSPPELTEQNLVVFLDDIKLGEFSLSARATISCPFPGAGQSVSYRTFRFEHPDAKSPAELSISADERRLGFAVHSISFGTGQGLASPKASHKPLDSESVGAPAHPLPEPEPNIAAPASAEAGPSMKVSGTERPALSEKRRGRFRNLLGRK